jgi:hypothetical protein
MNNKEVIRECYFIALLDGATIEKNKTTMCSMKSIGNITRYQVFSSRGGKDFFETYTYPDVCVDKFLELTK